MDAESQTRSSTPVTDKIVVAGDWHGDIGWAKVVIEYAARLGVTKLLHVGDLGIGPWPGDRGGRTFENKLNRICFKTGVDLYCVPGNHENWATIERLEPRADGWLQLREHVLVAPGGLRWIWSGVEFGALGGAFSVDAAHRVAERDWWPVREEVRPEHLERLGSEPLDVLVTHDVPAGVDLFRAFEVGPATAARALVSQDLLAEAVQRTTPELVLSGHWHQRCTAYLPLPDGARTSRRTVAERHRGADEGEPRWVTRVEVLDLGQEYVSGGSRTDRNWVLLDPRDLSVEEQHRVEARMRGGETTDAASEVDELDVETARGCWVIRSRGSTAYYLDFEAWRLLRTPGEGSSTGAFDNVWVPLVSAVNDKGEARITVGSRHRFVTDPEPASTDYRTWISRACTSITPVAKADLPVGVPAHEEAGKTPFILGSARVTDRDPGTPRSQPDDTRTSVTDHLAGVAGRQGADLHEVARLLVSHLGPTLAAALAGATAKEQAIEWAKPDGPEPPADAARRLEVAHRVWTEVAGAEGDDVARAWFVGGNPRLGGETPMTAIRESRATEVMAAVRAFLEDRPDGRPDGPPR